jgi:hypothetical protein
MSKWNSNNLDRVNGLTEDNHLDRNVSAKEGQQGHQIQSRNSTTML